MKWYIALFYFIFSFLLNTTAYCKVACLVSQLNGQAFLTKNNENYYEITNFEKISVGDNIKLGDGARIRLCFLRNGRIEEWCGPVNLIVHQELSNNSLNVSVPIVKEYGEIKSVLRDSKVLNGKQELVSGQVTIRSAIKNKPLDQKQIIELNNSEIFYDLISSKSAEGDYTADIIYIARLEKLGQKRTLYKHLQKLLEKDTDNKMLLQMFNDL